MVRKYKGNKAFTLVELLIVIAIIAILAVVVVPNAFGGIEKSKVSSAIADYRGIKTAALNYYTDTSTWPADGAADTGFVSKPTGVTGWNGPYIEKWPAKNPWGGTYAYKSGTVSWRGTSTTARYLQLTSVTEKAYNRLVEELGADVVSPATFPTGGTIDLLINKD